MGITAIWAEGNLEGPKPNNHSGSASLPFGVSTPSAASPTGVDLLLPLTVGNDGMEPDEFARAIYHCGDFKTWDGMCTVSQVRRRSTEELFVLWPFLTIQSDPSRERGSRMRLRVEKGGKGWALL